MADKKKTWAFEPKEISKDEKGVISVVLQGTDPAGKQHVVVARDHVDKSYPERFKINWNGNKPRLATAVSFGGSDADLVLGRGERIQIARTCLKAVKDIGIDKIPTRSAPTAPTTPATVTETLTASDVGPMPSEVAADLAALGAATNDGQDAIVTPAPAAAVANGKNRKAHR